MSQTRERTVARILPKEIEPETVNCPKSEEIRLKSPMEITGEKSRFLILNQPHFEKKFIYGSHIVEINLPNRVNFAPGTQLNTILMKQKMVKTITTNDSIEKIVVNISFSRMI